MKNMEILELLQYIDRGYLPTEQKESELCEVHELDLCGTRISQLPDSLGRLTNLQTLYLSDTQITELPESIGQLANLQALYLNVTPIRQLPGSIGRLANLQYLNLGWTQISQLPDSFTQLANLQSLFLGSTQISQLPDFVGQLPALENLWIFDLHLHHIPASLALRGLPFYVNLFAGIEPGIYMGGTTLVTQPVSLFEQPQAFIEDYFRQKQIPVSESKVIFLGDGEVGKSYTIQRIRNGGRRGDYKTKMTPGVDILDHHVEVKGERPFDIKFWDFGGQEIMHSMHRCFLTERTCYVVLVSTRLGSQTERARYWLRSIRSYAPKAPVLLVVNQWEGYPGGIDKESLFNEFPSLIKEIPELSVKGADDRTFARLMNAVTDMAGKMDSREMELPEKWNNIRMALLNQRKPYIDKDEYYRICRENGLKKGKMAAWLLSWFNDMGVCFSYHQDKQTKQELERYKLLSPEWLTNAIYAIVMEGYASSSHGIISRERINELLGHPAQMKRDAKGQPYRRTQPKLTYKPEECGYILEIMEKFRLTYPVPQSAYQSDSPLYFIPALCSGNTPPNLKPDSTLYPVHFTYQMSYVHLSDTVLHRLMIFCFNALRLDKCWQRGMVVDFTRQKGYLGLITMEEDKFLKIELYGKENCEPIHKLLDPLREEINAINRSLNLKAKEYILLTDENNEKEAVLFQTLLTEWEKGQTSHYVGQKEYALEPLMGPLVSQANEIEPLPLAEPSRELIELLRDAVNALNNLDENTRPNPIKEFLEIGNSAIDFITKLPGFLWPAIAVLWSIIWYFFFK